MNIVWTIIAFILLSSLIFLGVNLARTHALSRRFRLTESCYTLLFGACRLRHFLILYVFFVMAYSVGAIFFISYLSRL